MGAYGAYLLHATLTFMVAWKSWWPLPISRPIGWILGLPMVVLGHLLYVAGVLALRSFRASSGLAADELVTTGVYRGSRNPQLVGWGLILAGVSLTRRSALALLLAGLHWAGVLLYIVSEERFLETTFGERYRHYRAETPRFLGRPHHRMRAERQHTPSPFQSRSRADMQRPR